MSSHKIKPSFYDECFTINGGDWEFETKLAFDGEYVAGLQVDSNGNSDFECMHPESFMEFGDDDERGVCTLCGSECDWAWVKDVDEGRDEDGNYTAKEIQVREAREWHRTDRQCLIQKLIAKTADFCEERVDNL